MDALVSHVAVLDKLEIVYPQRVLRLIRGNGMLTRASQAFNLVNEDTNESALVRIED